MAVKKAYNAKEVYFSDRLWSKLGMIRQYPCTLIEAPMGYGKTTAVREYLKTQECCVAFKKMHDNSVSGFWSAFCALFVELDANCAENLMQLGFPNDGVSREKALLLVQNSLHGETVFVLDDYHMAECPQVSGFIEFLLWNELSDLHIVLTARYTSFDCLDELILKSYIYYINKEDLEFTPDDIMGYYRKCGVSINNQESHRLFDYTEGWVSALYLLVINFMDSGCFSTPLSISILIEKAVFLRFSEEIKAFLLKLSLLESFTLEQASFIWQADAGDLLSEIMQKNAFIKFDNKSGTFFMHKLFSEFLKDIFETISLVEKNAIRRRTADWYAQKGEYIAAISFYYLAEDFDSLLHMLEIDQGHSILNEHRKKLITYFDECPVSVRQNHPVALLVYAMCLFTFNDAQRFSEVCVELSGILQSGAIDTQTAQELNGELELLLSFTEYNDIEKMSIHIKNAADMLKNTSQFMDTRGVWTFGSPSVLYMFHRGIGELDKETQLLKDSKPCYDSITKGHGKGAEHVMEAEKHYLRTDLSSAEICLHNALYQASSFHQMDIIICAALIQMRIAVMSGDYTFVKNRINELRNEIEQGKFYHLLHTLDLCETFIYASLQQKDRIPKWIAQGNFYSSKLYYPTMAFFNIVYGRVLLIRGEYHKLLGCVDEFIETASVFPSVLSKIYIFIYAAAAYEMLLRRQEALNALHKSLDMALPDRIVMPFVENCDYIKSLLEEIHRHGDYREDIVSILEQNATYCQSVKSVQEEYFTHKRPKLTQRESDIALLIAEGLSNSEIASRLFISQNTVKTILKKIFEKFGIDSRSMLKFFVEQQMLNG